jgi:phage terminase small subunit
VTRPAGLNPKRALFVTEYVIDHNATQAAIRAGYSAKTAKQQGARLLTDVDVCAAVAVLDAKHAADCGITVQYILTKLKENLERALQAVEVLDRDGNSTGAFEYDGAVANRAAELLGKHLGMFADRIKFEDVAKLTDAELEAKRKALGLG